MPTGLPDGQTLTLPATVLRQRRTLGLVQRDSDEDAWRGIVENYGERVELEEEPPAEAPTEPPADPTGDPTSGQRLERLFRPLPQPAEPDDEPDDDFVPPTPPPLPKLPPDRLLAWVGLFGSPTILLVSLVLDIHLPPWLGYLLVASFIGGFVYLVVNMPRGEDVDPWDDGARL
jgi:hypothetical protein